MERRKLAAEVDDFNKLHGQIVWTVAYNTFRPLRTRLYELDPYKHLYLVVLSV
jgi:hypothetical protein